MQTIFASALYSTTTSFVPLHPCYHCSRDLDDWRNHKWHLFSVWELEHFKDTAVRPCVLIAPIEREYGFHSQLHKHTTCSRLDGTGLRWPDTNSGFLTLGGATQLLQDQQSCTPDPHRQWLIQSLLPSTGLPKHHINKSLSSFDRNEGEAERRYLSSNTAAGQRKPLTLGENQNLLRTGEG